MKAFLHTKVFLPMNTFIVSSQSHNSHICVKNHKTFDKLMFLLHNSTCVEKCSFYVLFEEKSISDKIKSDVLGIDIVEEIKS